jgi:NAD(P)-dependent dehydrogenase (short-subunit alcohol dehydrogenase family)
MADTTFGPQGWTLDRLSSLNGKTCLITSANGGAGFQAARTLLKKSAKLVMLNRKVASGHHGT